MQLGYWIIKRLLSYVLWNVAWFSSSSSKFKIEQFYLFTKPLFELAKIFMRQRATLSIKSWGLFFQIITQYLVILCLFFMICIRFYYNSFEIPIFFLIKYLFYLFKHRMFLTTWNLLFALIFRNLKLFFSILKL